jgi:hypothetical protein
MSNRVEFAKIIFLLKRLEKTPKVEFDDYDDCFGFLVIKQAIMIDFSYNIKDPQGYRFHSKHKFSILPSCVSIM